MENVRMLTRVVHLTSTGFLSGSIVLNYLFDTNQFLADDATFIEFANPVAGVLVLLSGIVITLLLKPKKEEAPEKKQKFGRKASEE